MTFIVCWPSKEKHAEPLTIELLIFKLKEKKRVHTNAMCTETAK